jgi:hypothetical protein
MCAIELRQQFRHNTSLRSVIVEPPIYIGTSPENTRVFACNIILSFPRQGDNHTRVSA